MSKKATTWMCIWSFVRNMRIDAVATVHFYETANGGLTQTFAGKNLHCPFQIGEALHDGVLLTNSQPIQPGQTVTCPVVFLWPDLVRPKLKVGLRFFIKKGSIANFGEGEITEVIEDNPRIN